MKRICVLVSGGLDSSVLLGLMAKQYQEVYPLYIQCGLRWESTELYWLSKYLKKIRISKIKALKILQVSVKELYGSHWSLTGKNIPGLKSHDEEVYLPGRNILLLTHAAVYCALNDIPNIAIGVLKGNPFPDSQRNFFADFERMVRRGINYYIKIHTPFSQMEKSDVLEKGQGLPLELTFSCLNPQRSKPCSKCNKCAEREKILN